MTGRPKTVSIGGGRHIVGALVLIMFLSVAGVGLVGAATTDDPITDYLDLGEFDEQETATNLFQNGSVTTASQDLSEGTTHEAIAGYEDDSGDWVADGNVVGGGDFDVNTTWVESSGKNANPYSFQPGHIVDPSYTEFPDKSGRTWKNASRWTVGTGSSNVTVSNTTVNADAEGVRFNTNSNGDSATGQVYVFNATYSAWDGELDSDESKRHFQIGIDIDTLDDNTNIEFVIYDESGSHKEIEVNKSRAIDTNADVLGNGTNDYVYQISLNEITTEGVDSSFDNIENITVSLNRTSGGTGDADFTISWLDLRKKAKNKLGEKRATTDDSGNDNDGDGEFDEFQSVYNATGDISIYSMETMDSEYDDAVVNDLTYPARYTAAGLDEQGQEGNYQFSWADMPSNPTYDHELNLTVSLKPPAAVDLSYSNWDTRMVQKWPEQRYLKIESASDVADSTNLSQASFSSDSSSLAQQGTTITIDSSTSAGERIVLQLELQLTQSDRDAIEVSAATPEGGAAAPAESGGGGGILGFGTGVDIAAALATLGAFLVGIPQRIWRGIMG